MIAVTSGGFGYTTRASIAYAYLPTDLPDPPIDRPDLPIDLLDPPFDLAELPTGPSVDWPVRQVGRDTQVEIELFGEWVTGRIVAGPLFDPKGERVRGRWCPSPS